MPPRHRAPQKKTPPSTWPGASADCFVLRREAVWAPVGETTSAPICQRVGGAPADVFSV